MTTPRFQAATARLSNNAFVPAVIDTATKVKHEIPLTIAVGGYTYERNALRVAETYARLSNEKNKLYTLAD